MKKLMILALAATSLSTLAVADDSQIERFSIRTFFGFTTGDVKDLLDIDNVYGVGFEYMMPSNSMHNGSWHLGAEYASTPQHNSLGVDTFGLYAGAAFALDSNNSSGMPKFFFVANAGYYGTVVHVSGGEAVYGSGFGFDAGFRYKMQNVALEFLYRMRPDTDGESFDNRSYSIGIVFPVKG